MVKLTKEDENKLGQILKELNEMKNVLKGGEGSGVKGHKTPEKWSGETDSGSEYHDLRSRFGLSHNDAVAVIEGRKTFKQVKEEWSKEGHKLEPLYDLK